MSSFLFQYYDESNLREVMHLYHTCTGLHTQLLSAEGRILVDTGEPAAFCTALMKHLPPDDTCLSQHLQAGLQALRFGESHLFSCHAGLHHIVYPILLKKTLLGSVIAGPFLMDEPDASLILDLQKKYPVDTESLLSLSDHSHHLPVITPAVVTDYQLLLSHLIRSLTGSSDELMRENQNQLLHQSRVNESIQQYKKGGVREEMEYPLELESRLVTKVQTGDLKEARKIMNELFAYLLLYEGHDMEKVKVRIVELCSVLSRAAIERGSDVNRVLEMNEKLISSILLAKDEAEISFKLYENMDIFTESLFFLSDKNNSMIRGAVEYIASHYDQEITLAEVAEQTHLNPSYLSTLFRQVTGQTFKEYLNRVRVQEAQRLLTHTDYPIMEISIACGFSDQSYFTKVFRKYTGLTPKQYR